MFKFLAVLSFAVLVTGSVIPSKPQLHLLRTASEPQHLRLPIALRMVCVAVDECPEGESCVQLSGDPICETDCVGVCVPREETEGICNCDNPCPAGNVCLDVINEGGSGNGVCEPDTGNSIGVIDCPNRDGDSEGDDGTDSEPPNKSDAPGADPEEAKGEADPDDKNDSEQPDAPTAPLPTDEEVTTEESTPTSSPTATPTIAPSISPETPNGEPTNPDDTTETETEGICIGVDMLTSFQSHELVFDKHILARVLCDAHGSCATGGHMVVYGGKAMMMTGYCDVVGCEEKVMLVNSPKFRRALRVRSRSEGMEFTSFAARFGTRGEEALLGAAVRLGL